MRGTAFLRFLNFGSIKFCRTAGLRSRRQGAAWQTFAVGGDDGGGESHFEIGAHPGFDVLSRRYRRRQSTAG